MTRAKVPPLQTTTQQLPNVISEVPAMLVQRIQEVRENIESLGEDFQLQKIKPTTDGLEIVEGEPPVKELTGVIILNKKINTYYEGVYNPNDIQPPTCFSTDGVLPSPSIQKPQNKTCVGCPKSEWGTNSMKSGKACANRQPIFILRSREDGGEFAYADIPRVISISPSSLKEVRKFFMDVTERGVAYWKVATKISVFKENSKDTYVKLKFHVAKVLTPTEVAAVKYLREYWQKWTDIAAIDKQGVEMGNKSNEETNAPQNF